MIKIHSSKLRWMTAAGICIYVLHFSSEAAVRKSVMSGMWNNPVIWSPQGIPNQSDEVIVETNHSILINTPTEIISVRIGPGGELNFEPGKMLTLQCCLQVDGKLNMNGGDILLANTGDFILGPYSEFIWDPSINSVAGASLFINGKEQFNPSSTLIIKKWYNYTQVPIGSVVSGNFGNLVLNSAQGNILMEWNQDNYFESHPVIGTLTVDKGWIVLDKSGRISQTQIGHIALNGTNSYLELHSGNHPGTFELVTGNVLNNGGNFYGLYNGNGNVRMHVSGNFINYGNVVLNYNTGIQNSGKGDVTLTVDGNYSQSKGDFRGIFNLSVFDAGSAELTFGTVLLSGGIFMGNYSCNASAGINRLTVLNNFYISFTLPQDKFRISGLTSLSGNYSKSKTEFRVGGNLTLSGISASEVTTSGSIGAESTAIEGALELLGCSFNGNLGSHHAEFHISGNIIINGGIHSFSKTPGSLKLTAKQSLTIGGGSVSLKENNGSAIFDLSDNFRMTGGTFFLHNNAHFTSPDSLRVTIGGSFNHSGGTINYDNHLNPESSILLKLQGKACVLSGTGRIIREGGTGFLQFTSIGFMVFQRLNGIHFIDRIRQSVEQGCILEIQSGNLQVASSANPDEKDWLRICGGGVLRAGTSKIFSNLIYNHSGVLVENDGKISTRNTSGLFNGTDQACINAAGNMKYFLSPYSIVEYNGTDNQMVTGTYSLSTPSHEKYGILEINFTGTPNVEKVLINSSSAFVRTQLRLNQGELFLNNFPITIESGNAGAISRINGYIKSDNAKSDNNGFIHWQKMDSSEHVFPFGYDAENYIPVRFTPLSGMGGTVSIATRSTGPDNLPFPSNNNPVTGITRDGLDISVSSVVDRWFDIIAAGITADVNISYRGNENTTADSLRDAAFGIQAWNGFGWSNTIGQQKLVTSGIGTVAVKNISQFNHWIISSFTQKTSTNDFIEFTASVKESIVQLHWKVLAENKAASFEVERSEDNIQFSPIGKVAVHSSAVATTDYDFNDASPLVGMSYYRILQINPDGTVLPSHSERVILVIESGENPEILAIAPNPFTNLFTISFHLGTDAPVMIKMMDCNGKIIQKEIVFAKVGINSYKCSPMHNLQQGIYVIAIVQNKKSCSAKIIKS